MSDFLLPRGGVCADYCAELSRLYQGALGPFGQYTSVSQYGRATLGNFAAYFFSALEPIPQLEASVAISTGVAWRGSGVWAVTDPSQPIFTESRWDYTKLQTFLQGDPATEWVVLVAGLASVVGHAFVVRAAATKVRG